MCFCLVRWFFEKSWLKLEFPEEREKRQKRALLYLCYLVLKAAFAKSASFGLLVWEGAFMATHQKAALFSQDPLCVRVWVRARAHRSAACQRSCRGFHTPLWYSSSPRSLTCTRHPSTRWEKKIPKGVRGGADGRQVDDSLERDLIFHKHAVRVMDRQRERESKLYH